MDHLWSPWRYTYLRASADGELDASACVFCRAPEAEDPAAALVLGRGRFCYAILNLYPYTNGHLMIVPYRHASMLADVDGETTAELMELTKVAQLALGEVYRPQGFNIGMNLGQAAGAGIDQHLHLHILPRWFGDANFMTVVGETRVIPEALGTTYERLRPFFPWEPAA